MNCRQKVVIWQSKTPGVEKSTRPTRSSISRVTCNLISSLKAKKFGIYIVHTVYKRWPSDKANRSCEIPVHKHEWGNWYCCELCMSRTSWPLVISKIFVAYNLPMLLLLGLALFCIPGVFDWHITTFCLQFIGNLLWILQKQCKSKFRV